MIKIWKYKKCKALFSPGRGKCELCGSRKKTANSWIRLKKEVERETVKEKKVAKGGE